MKRSISMTIGKGSVTHNSRKFVAENVDATRIYDNRIYIDEPIKDVYHLMFDEALARYNDKQKEKIDALMTIMKRFGQGNRRSCSMKLFFRSVTKMICLPRHPKEKRQPKY